MAVKTKHTFPNAVGTNGQSATVFAGHGIELNNLDDLDVYVTLSGGTRVLQLRQASGSTAQSSHPQVNNTDGLYFPAVSAGTTLYNYQLTTANDTITFNSALPTGAVVTVERRTGDEPSDYTTFAGGSTVRHTDLNRSATESNYTAQEARNKVFEIEGKLFGDAAKDSSFITSADIVDGTIVAADLASNAVTTVKIQDDAVTGDKLNNTGVTAGSYTVSAITVDAQGRLTAASNGSIGGANIAADAIDSSKLADNAVNSEHYVDGSIDAVHLATDAVTSAKIQANAVGSSELATNAVTTVKVAADAINGDKIADDSIDSEHYVNGSIDTDHIGNNQITSGKLADDSVITAKIADNNVTLAKLGSGALPTDITVNADNLVANSVGTSEIAADAINGTKIADNAIGSEHIAANAVTTSELADAELTTLAGMPSGTASILASSTALTSTTAELNLLDGKSIATTISGSSTDNQLPTAKAVNDAVANISDAGNFVPIANEVSFPNSNPDPGNNAGTIVSIADAGGIVVNGSGVSTTGRTLGGSTVTINGIDSSLYNTTIAAGKGMLVQTTTTTHTYDYHRLVVDEAGVAAAQTLVSDFNNRYRIGSSNPTSSLDDGDLFFNTTSNKMLVYNDTDSSWDEVQSVGNYFINTISSYSGTGGNSATFNGTAYRFVLSNAGTKAEQHLVSINGVIQKPNSGTSQPSEGFAIDGSSIIFSNAPATGSDYFIITIGSSVNIGTPSNNTVSTATIQNLAVTGDKIATNLDLADNKKIRFGTGDDLQIYHNGSHSVIKESGTGALKVVTNSSFQVRNADETTGEYLINANVDGSVELYDNGSKKFHTHSTGVTVTGYLHIEDGSTGIGLGNSDDLKLYHDGSHSYIRDTGTGNLNIDGSKTKINNAAGTESLLTATENAGVELYYDNSKKFETTSSGVNISGTATGINLATASSQFTLDVGGEIASKNAAQEFIGLNLTSNEARIRSSYYSGASGAYRPITFFTSDSERLRIETDGLVKIPDNGKFVAGTGSDLQIYHDGSNSKITNATGNFIIEASASGVIALKPHTNENGIITRANGASELYYDNAKKLETTSSGVEISGKLTFANDGLANGSINLGADADLNLYHDNSNAYIDNNTGDFYIRNAGDNPNQIYIQGKGGEHGVIVNGNGSVDLYYDNSKKLETTSSGITVTGSVTTNDINMSNLNAPTPNEVDGTRGNWTMQEGADDLFLINRSNGKKYKFNLTEVS